MSFFFRKILLVTFFSCLLVAKGTSQIDLSGKPLIHLRINESHASISEGDSILKYFIGESNKYTTYSFDNSKQTLSDSIFPNIKQIVNSLLDNYKGIEIYLDTISEFVIQTYNKITAIQKVVPGQRNRKELKDISDALSRLPTSKEKVLLTVNYLGLQIGNSTTIGELFGIFSQSSHEAELIEDFFERAKAYLYIGDYFLYLDAKFYPMIAFYRAQAYFYASDRDSIIKYNFQGIICKKLAKLFPNTNTEILTGIEKQCNYYITATDFFNHANNFDEADQTFSSYLSNYTYLYATTEGNKYFDHDRKETKANVLHYLGDAYIKLTRTGKIPGERFFWFNNIGTVLRADNKYEEAKSFFLLAIASGGRDLNDISECLRNVSLIYASLKKKNLALNYSDLLITIAEKTRLRKAVPMAILNKANVFFTLNQYDSALAYANKINGAFKSDLLSDNYSLSEKEALLLAYKLKLKIFLFRKSDSVSYYKNEYNELLQVILEDYTHLLITENQEVANWFSKIKTWEISNQKQSAESNKEMEKQEGERKIFTLVFIFILLTAIIFLIGHTNRLKAEKKADTLKNQNIQLNELAKNKIHNFRSDITDIDNLIKQKSPLLNTYIEAYKDFLKSFFRNWETEKKLTLKEELEEFKSYLKVKQVTQNISIIESILITNPDKVLFLQSVFDTLLDNSVKWGFKDNTQNFIFKISIYQDGDFIICEITDNGIPPGNNTYPIREDSGLNTLRKRLKNFYSIVSKNYDSNYFLVTALPNNKGTYVKLTLPYEKA